MELVFCQVKTRPWQANANEMKETDRKLKDDKINRPERTREKFEPTSLDHTPLLAGTAVFGALEYLHGNKGLIHPCR